MKIKNITLKNNLILAPMAGVTDAGFRSLCVQFGADYGVCEMISAKALKYGSKKTIDLLNTDAGEKVLVAQIFGNDPKIMAQAVASPHLQKFDIIDINMGCPAPKIVGNGEGSALMRDAKLARSIIEACVQNTDKPITVKFRKGWASDSVNAVEFAKMCEAAGASALTIHGRTKQEGYGGNADLETIRQVKLAVNIPVIGNGDVVCQKSLNNMINTGVDAVMIGRGALGDPAIFAKLLGREVGLTKWQMVKRHVAVLRQFHTDAFIVKHLRKHFLWYLKGVPNSATLKQEIVLVESLPKALKMLKTVLE